MPFVPRLTNTGMYNNAKWYADNPFYQSGYGLPNCTCYAWGRMWELSGVKPTGLSTGNAGNWYSGSRGFVKSQTPVLGAIGCFGKYGGAGHVWVVEKILNNGDLVISNSGYRRPIASYPPSMYWFFNTQTYPKATNYLTSGYQSSGYYFQGFLHPPKYADGSSPILGDVEWSAKPTGSYNRDSHEAIGNAYLILDILAGYGFTTEAVCGILGNMGSESGYNPWRWEGDIIQSQYGSSGYGLAQFTPATKYIQSAYAKAYSTYAPNTTDLTGKPEDGDAQTRFIAEHADYAATSQYNISYAEYKQLTDVEYAAAAWLYNYERPGSYSTLQTRIDEAVYWYGVLQGVMPEYPTGATKNKMPVWMMIRARRW